MDLLNTSRFRVDLLTQLCVLMCVCEVNTAQSSKMAFACFSIFGCDQITLDCNAEQIIRLVDQQYNYAQNSEHHCNASGGNNSQCNQYRPGSCCVIKNDNCMAPVSKEQTFTLFETCSGKQTCSAKATNGRIEGCTAGINGNAPFSDSYFLTYNCDNETDTVQLCSNMSHTSNSINVIFNGASTMPSYTTSQTCSCSINSTSQYHAYFQDFRPFRPGNTKECSSISLNVTEKMCKGSKKDAFIYQSPLNITSHTITARNLFSQGRDDRPTMVWIRIKSNESDPNPLTVTCTGATPGDTDTSTISVTASLPTSSTSATVKKSMTTSPSSTSPMSLPNGGTTHAATSDTSDGDTSMTTPPSSASPTSLPNGGTTQAATSDTSDGTGVPSAAIVVPIVLVLLGLAAGVGIWYWCRKRQGRHENEQNSKDNKTYGQKNGLLISPGKISMSRLPDNYIDFDVDQGDEYSTIDKSKVKLSLPNVKVTNDGGDDNYGYAMPTDAIREDDTEYNVVNLKSMPVVQDPNYSHLPGTKCDEDDEYSHINGPSSPVRPAPVISDSSADVYSHLQGSTKTTAQQPSDGANVYYHMKGVKAIERTHQDVEDNTYDHANSSREGNQEEHTASSMTTPTSSTYSHVTMPSAEKQPEDNGAESHEYFVLEKVHSREESV